MTRDDILKAYARGRRDFAGATLEAADLRGADLSRAALNWQSHELMAEVLRQAAGKCPQRRALAGLVLASPDWCWDQFLALDIPQKMWALKTLRKLSTHTNPMPGAKH